MVGMVTFSRRSVRRMPMTRALIKGRSARRADTKDDSMFSEMSTLPGDRRAKVTADVRRPNGRVVTVRFLIFRNADLGDVIARAEVLGGGVCVAHHGVWPASREW